MVMLPTNTRSIRDVMAKYDSESVKGKQRTYLGMSSLGNPCMRDLWYGFHWCVEKFTERRVQRIFDRGDWEEHRIIRDLKAVGVECFRRDKDGNKIEIFGHKDEKQEEYVGFAGHAKGHNDGRALNIPDAPTTEHNLEFKTANDKNFKKYPKLGVEEANPVYYAQSQRYMHEQKLTRTLFCITNKDNESRYWERIPYRKEFALDLVRKEQHIIMSDSPLERIGGRTWHECKYCKSFGICHDNDAPAINCRTCDHSDIENDGIWSCSYKEQKLSVDEQRAGCKYWKIGWGL